MTVCAFGARSCHSSTGRCERGAAERLPKFAIRSARPLALSHSVIASSSPHALAVHATARASTLAAIRLISARPRHLLRSLATMAAPKVDVEMVSDSASSLRQQD